MARDRRVDVKLLPASLEDHQDTADRGIFAGMYMLTVAGFSLWTIYGVMLGAWPLVATNAICLSLSGFILGMKLLPRGKRAIVADALDPSNKDARDTKRSL